MPDTRQLANQISALFSERLHLQVPSLDTDLIDTGLVDSLTFVEFLAQLEKEFGIHVSLEDLEIDHFRTISRIARFRQPPRTALEDRIDERRQRGALGEHEQRAHEQHQRDDREQPPLLAHAHEGPQLPRQARVSHSRHPP